MIPWNKKSVFIVAEMSANHGGCIEKARELVKAAANSGADAIKLQTFRPDTITIDSDSPDFRLDGNTWSDYGTLWNLYEKAQTPWEWHKELFDLAKNLGLVSFSSPFDLSAVDFLEELSCPIYKIASPEIVDLELLKRAAQTGKPVVVSTGLATENDIDLAINTLRNENCTEIVLLKCTSAYPTPPDEMNLQTIAYLNKRYQVKVGLSDHSAGSIAPIIATSLGACFIEKHIVLDKRDDTPDSFFSLDPLEFKSMVESVRLASKMIGDINLSIQASAKSNLGVKRSIYVTSHISEGEEFSKMNIASVRPGYSLHPKYFPEIIGKRAKKSFSKGDRLQLNDFM